MLPRACHARGTVLNLTPYPLPTVCVTSSRKRLYTPPSISSAHLLREHSSVGSGSIGDMGHWGGTTRGTTGQPCVRPAQTCRANHLPR